MKVPDIKASSLVVIAGGLQSLANIAFLSICSRTYSAADYSLVPLYFTLQGLLMVFCYQGMDSMINRAMLDNHISFYKKALKTSFKFSLGVSFILLLILMGYFSYFSLERSYFILLLLIILQIPISALEKIECGLLGLNKFRELILYKLISSLISISPLIGTILGAPVLWIISLIVITRIAITFLSILYLRRIIQRVEGNDDYDVNFYLIESKKMSFLSAFSTALNYFWPLILFKIDPLSLSVYFNGNKIPEKIKDYSKLFVSIPSQHWLKKGKEYFSNKLQAKGIYIFVGSLIFSILLILSANWYIPLIFGEKYKSAILISQIIFMGVPARVLSAIHQSREIFHEKNTSFFRTSNYLQSILNLILAMPMIYYFKEVGLAAHSLIMSYIGYVISALRFRYIKKIQDEKVL